jgi:hypothetical protein
LTVIATSIGMIIIKEPVLQSMFLISVSSELIILGR